MKLPRAFFARDTVTVARELLGQRLVRLEAGRRLSGIIIETEAYVGETDLACHARAGRTPRTTVMYGPPGCAYVYLNYGLHWMLNIVTERNGFPAAVLIRAIEPMEGVEVMRRRRGHVPDRQLTNGPGKLAQALHITGSLHGHDLCARGAVLFVERAGNAAPSAILARPRIGIHSVPEPWRSLAWNFRLSRE
ncbi:MAG: DNA-3-methyladenine glycosylase [Anaerolineales bacterium]|nr:DNA-3-methyladenine glycosylase [Anaerolineales bacterium]